MSAFENEVNQLDIATKDYYGDYEHFMTSSKLKLFAESTVKFDRQYRQGIKEPESESLVLGSLIHEVTLEPDKEDSEFFVSEAPVNPSTGKAYGRSSKKFQEWLEQAESGGKKWVSQEEYDRAKDIAKAVAANPAAADLLSSDVEREVTLRGRLAEVSCQSRIDLLCKKRRIFVDLKSTSDLGVNHNNVNWSRDFFRYGYDKQLAFYRLMLAKAFGKRFQPFLIVVDKHAPHESAVISPCEKIIERAEHTVMSLMCEYADRLKSQDFGSRASGKVFVIE